MARLTNHSETDGTPAWSPDGTRIAFTSDRDGDNDEIYVMNADGSGVTRLTNHSASDWMPTWSPDGARIAFASQRDGDFEIYVIDVPAPGAAPRAKPGRTEGSRSQDDVAADAARTNKGVVAVTRMTTSFGPDAPSRLSPRRRYT